MQPLTGPYANSMGPAASSGPIASSPGWQPSYGGQLFAGDPYGGGGGMKYLQMLMGGNQKPHSAPPPQPLPISSGPVQAPGQFLRSPTLVQGPAANPLLSLFGGSY